MKSSCVLPCISVFVLRRSSIALLQAIKDLAIVCTSWGNESPLSKRNALQIFFINLDKVSLLSYWICNLSSFNISLRMLSNAEFARPIARFGSFSTLQYALSNVWAAVSYDYFNSFLNVGTDGMKSGVSIPKSIAIFNNVSQSTWWSVFFESIFLRYSSLYWM